MADAVTLARAIIEIGTNGISDTEKQLNALDAELTKVGTDYAAGTIRIDEYLGKSQRLQSQIAELKAGLDVASEAVKKHGSTAAASAALADRSARSTRNLGQAALEGSRALEDLQYGLAGVINNVPTLVSMMGGSAGLAAAFSLVAVGINQLVKHWDDLRGMFETRNPVPQATDILTRYRDALEKTNKELGELKDKTSLNATEMVRFNELTARQADLQKKISDEAERQQRIKSAVESQSPEDAERRQAMQHAVAGMGRSPLDDLQKALEKEAEFKIGQMRIQVQDEIDAFNKEGHTIEETREKLTRVNEGFQIYARDLRAVAKKTAEDLFNELLKGGKVAQERVLDLMETFGSGPLARKIRENDPEAKRNAELIAKLNRQAEEGEEAMRAARNQALIDELNRQGQEGEKIGLAANRQMKKEQATAKAGAQVQAKAQIGRQIDVENRSITSGGYVEKAEALMAQLRAQGGAIDNAGRLHKMTQDQMFDFVAAQVRKELHRVVGFNQFGQAVRANAGMNKQQTEDIANVITSRANTDLQKRLTEMGADAVNNTQALLSITQQLIGAVGNLQNQQARLRLGIADAQRQTRALQRTALSRPGG